MYLSIASITSCKAAMPNHSLLIFWVQTCANPSLPSPGLLADFLFPCPDYSLLQDFGIAWFHCQLEFFFGRNYLRREGRRSCSLLMKLVLDMRRTIAVATFPSTTCKKLPIALTMCGFCFEPPIKVKRGETDSVQDSDFQDNVRPFPDFQISFLHLHLLVQTSN